jgi:hypothetical protein
MAEPHEPPFAVTEDAARRAQLQLIEAAERGDTKRCMALLLKDANKQRKKQQQPQQEQKQQSRTASKTPEQDGNIRQHFARFIDACPENRGTALVNAVWNAHCDTARALLAANASVCARSDSGANALHAIGFAAADKFKDAKQCVALCTALLRAHDGAAALESTSSLGWTPLLCAAHQGSALVCTTLLRAGANVFHTDQRGRRAFDLALVPDSKPATQHAILAWLKTRIAAAVFAQGMRHAYDTHASDNAWTDSPLFDRHLIGEITAFLVVPQPDLQAKATTAAALRELHASHVAAAEARRTMLLGGGGGAKRDSKDRDLGGRACRFCLRSLRHCLRWLSR